MKVECEQCGKNVMSRNGFMIDMGTIGITGGYVGFPDGSRHPRGIEEDGVFCSLDCIAKWIGAHKSERKR